MANAAMHNTEPGWSPGERIRKVRKAMGLDQVEFGELLGVKGATVSKWENDNGAPEDLVATAEAIARAAQAAGVGWVTSPWVLGLTIVEPLYAAWDSNPQPTDSGLLTLWDELLVAA